MDRYAGGHDEPHLSLTPHEQTAHDMVMRGHREELKVKLWIAVIAVCAFWVALVAWVDLNLAQIAIFTPSYVAMLVLLQGGLHKAYYQMYLDEGFVYGRSAERRGDR